jgi:lysophospholipase L1-like esterase
MGNYYSYTVSDTYVLAYDSEQQFIGYAGFGETTITDFECESLSSYNKIYIPSDSSIAYVRVIFWQTETNCVFNKGEELLTDNIISGVKTNSYYLGKTLVTYGDSLTALPWAGWQDTVISALGFSNHTNLGVGGSTMTNVTGRNPMSSETRINAIKTANPDVVTIFAGANDMQVSNSVGTNAELDKSTASKDKSTYIGAYSYLIETLLTWKPSLQILIINQYNYDWDNSYGTKTENIRTATKTIANYYNLNIVDCNELGINKFTKSVMLADNVHMSATGKSALAGLVISGLNKMAYKI